MRHSDGGRCAVAARRGGRVQEILDHVIDEQGSDEVSIKPGSGKLGFLRGQPVKAQEALQALEREFDLPTQAIKRQHAFGRVLSPIQRGEGTRIQPPRRSWNEASCPSSLPACASGAGSGGRQLRFCAGR